VVEGAWARSMPAGANSAVYLVLQNRGDEPDHLTGGETEAAVGVEIHESRLEDGIMRMRELEEVAVEAGNRVEFRPGGIHIMLLELREPLAAGDSIRLLLHFQQSGSQTLQVPVRAGAEG